MWPTIGLPLRMEAVNVHGEIESVVHCLDTVPSELVGFVNTFGVPIRPVQLILKQSQSKGVWQSCNANTKENHAVWSTGMNGN